jgi:type I restriction enzyme R subunit
VGANEAWLELMEPVEQPRGDDQVYAYFSSPHGVLADPDADEKARRRQALYKIAGRFARAFATVAEDPSASGFNDLQMAQYRNEVERALNIRNAVRLHSGDAVDFKLFEPAMRHLIDTYIKADDSEVVSDLDDISLLDLVASKGADAANAAGNAMGGKKENVAEAIENNVRKLIIDETPVNPKFYEKMSELLADLVKQRRDEAIAYAEYLERIADLVRQAKQGYSEAYPDGIRTPGQKALYDNLGNDRDAARAVDNALQASAPDGWRDNRMKERLVRRCIADALSGNFDAHVIFEVVKAQHEY